MSSPCERPECGGEVHTDGWGTPVRCPHESDRPFGFPRQCPHCGNGAAFPDSQLDDHIAEAHADLPPCTARISNAGTRDQTVRCVFRAGHRDEYGEHHAGPFNRTPGRYRWADHAMGAVPHQPEPIRLAVSELVPVLTALERRQRQRQAGHRILLYPLPACPSCGAPPDEMTTATSPNFLTDTAAITFERCGHSFTATGEDIQEAAQQARRMVDEIEQQPVGEDMFLPRNQGADGVFRLPTPEFLVCMREDDGTLIVGIRPDGSIATGPRYQPDAAAREFWDAVTRAAQAANPFHFPDPRKEQS